MDARRGTPQTREPETTLWDGGDLGALLCRKPLEMACISARLASWMASQIAAPVADVKLV
jgi:hypothetical protein